MAITLPVNAFLGTLSNLIAYAEVADTAQRGTINRLVNACQNTNVPYGDGKIVRSVDLPAVGDTDFANSTLLSVSKPTTKEQYIPVENFKTIQTTINQYLVAGAFINEEQMSSFISYIMKVMQVAKEAYLYKGLVSLIENYVPTQGSQTVTVSTFDTTGLLDPAQLQMAKTYNSNAIAESLLKVMQSMSAPTDKYNDDQLTEIIDYSTLVCFMRSKYDVNLIMNTFAKLFNSQKITEDERWAETIVIPDDQFTSPGDVICWLADRQKFQYGFFYQVATAFFDGSNLNQNNWLHFAYYMASIKSLCCVKFVEDASLTPTALS